jgi:cation:H+ antiporter
LSPLVTLVSTTVLVLQWLVLRATGVHLAPGLEALASGAAIFGAAFLLSWAAEVAQLDIPRGLAIAFLAVIAVLPEYAVDLYLAWQAAQHPEYVGYATANMTGANRLLIGVGWASLVFILWARTRGARRSIELDRAQSLELKYLFLATAYAFFIPLKGTLSITDTVVLLVLFGLYVRRLLRAPVEPPHLVGPAATIATLGMGARRGVTIAIFAYSALGILLAAEPFAESLIAMGRDWAIPEYLLIQWVAPLASEAPEFIVAILFVLGGGATAGLGMLLSSKVNQWTLLVGALPLAYSVAVGAPAAMPLNEVQVREIFLTAAQSAFGVVVLASFALSLPEAALLLGLFLAQVLTHLPELLSSTPAAGAELTHYAGYAFGALYLAFAAVWIVRYPDTRTGLVAILKPSAWVEAEAHERRVAQ